MAHCLSCQRVNPPDRKFCERCGKPLLLLERYRALRKLGEGGFGKTYLAHDEAKPSRPYCVIKQFIYNGPGQDNAIADNLSLSAVTSTIS